ncbi:MAG TPA: response regulator transcription factor [Slackia equolifaciens]|uniref:Response regulator transcription factor n=1 Tax=Slackia equolifaciens TaxID=498718 RepID=A0A9D2UXC4_9ACTN|nr:response regulator transcription factor [Slackia equolifaciens]
MNKVMLIDDDAALHAVIARVLERGGYSFCGAMDGESGMAMMAQEDPDLLILDVMLPDANGFDLCARLRAEGSLIPVIFLSGKTDIVDKTIGFRAGGDDYITKPFDPAELVLRIEACMRRALRDFEAAQVGRQTGTVQVGDLEICLDDYCVYANGTQVHLTAKEFEIVALLAGSPGKVFTVAQIQEGLWGAGETDSKSNSITVMVRKIRKKIEENPSEPRYLLTVQGVGYKFWNGR